MKMNRISGDLLNRAIAIYVQHAYRGRPEKPRNIPHFDARASLDRILSGAHPFEDLTGETPSTLAADPVPVAGGTAPRVYALRLGNAAYPHMKLALLEAFYDDEFVFTVDRHDTFHFEPDVPGYQAWCELKEINRLVKESIEAAWHKAGVPTLRGLRERHFDHPDLVHELLAEGQTLLILDDDEARAELLKKVLEEDGYQVLVGPPGPKPKPEETAVIRAMQKARGESLRLPASAVQGAADVDKLCDLIAQNRVVLIVLDVSYRTGQGPRVAGALRLDVRSQDIPIVAVYSRRDFGPDPDLFSTSLRRPYRREAIKELVEHTLMRRSRGGSGIQAAIP